MRRDSLLRTYAPLLWMFGVTVFLCVIASAQDKPKPPDDTKLYVWPAPDKGTQSLLVLRALDGETVEAAYLVPVNVVLPYQAGKPRATKDQLEALLTGKLLPCDLRGRDRFGRVVGDFYLGKDGWLTEVGPTFKVDKPQPKK